MRTLMSNTDALSLPFELDTLRDKMLSSGSVKLCVQAIYAGDRAAFDTVILDLALQPELRARFASGSSTSYTVEEHTGERARVFREAREHAVPLNECVARER